MTQPELEIRTAWRHAVGPDHDRYVDALLIRYGEPHRHYHTATHIMRVIRNVNDVAAVARRQPSAELVAAALYHDAIYDPRADDNESVSARLASTNLGEIGWSPDRCAVVKVMIEATASHTAEHAAGHDEGHDERYDEISAETAVLLDADLAILGGDPQSYQAYVNGVRAEYFFVDDDHWRTGRSRILQGFLDRPRIFATEYMHTELEHRARANIEAELAALTREQPGWRQSVAGD